MAWGPQLTWLFFVMAWGACAGSLINVLVYRMPRGVSVVSPPSRCPHCNTRLKWKDNIPVFGWIFLRGRCRYCRAPISPEYPIVEAITSALFGVTFALLFLLHPFAEWLGMPIGAIRPEWARNWPGHVWPIAIVWFILLGSLIAMSIVDAKTFTIPIELAWAPTLVALVVHPATAARVEHGTRTGHLLKTAGPQWVWAIATPLPTNWWWIGASIGAAVGIIIGVILLQTGLLRRSYADYEEWEREALGESESAKAAQSPTSIPDQPDPTLRISAATPPDESQGQVLPPRPEPPEFPPPAPATVEPPTATVAQPPPATHPFGWRWLLIPATMLVIGVLAAVIASTQRIAPGYGLILGLVIGAIPGAALWRMTRKPPPADAPTDDSPVHTWIAYPHARREALREVLFLAPCLALGLVGGYLGQRLGSSIAPLWLTVLAGVLMGYLIGGGIVWAVRILGSLALGKEAMGLGDVHLLAAVGACLGWIDAVLTFFLASFVALYWTLLRRMMYGGFSRAMPFGPNLAVAAALVILAKPWIEQGLAYVLSESNPVNIP